MFDDNKLYWDKRAKKYGHTGWAAEEIYAFDQKIRINVIKSFMEKQNFLKDGKILDYGGGDGTFAQALAPLCNEYYYYDLSEEVTKLAKKRLSDYTNIKYLYNLKEIKTCEKFNFIIAITVFQHILDDKDLVDTLSLLNSKLTDNGKLLILEDTFEKQDRQNEYIHYRTINEFEDLIKESGFHSFQSKGFYHPINNPTEGYIHYKNSFPIILYKSVRKLSRGKLLLHTDFDKLACKYIGNIEDYVMEPMDNDISRIFIAEK